MLSRASMACSQWQKLPLARKFTHSSGFGRGVLFDLSVSSSCCHDTLRELDSIGNAILLPQVSTYRLSVRLSGRDRCSNAAKACDCNCWHCNTTARISRFAGFALRWWQRTILSSLRSSWSSCLLQLSWLSWSVGRYSCKSCEEPGTCSNKTFGLEHSS